MNQENMENNENIKNADNKQIYQEIFLNSTKTKINNNLSYSEVKEYLEARINLTHTEQQDLWSNYVMKGMKNFYLIPDVVEENNIKSFMELKPYLLQLLRRERGYIG